MSLTAGLRCAIFCNVIDNFGDIGVCWRLARQLAAEYQMAVTLLVDDLASFAVLAPSIQPSQSTQMLDQITVQHWEPSYVFTQPFDVVIEGFGCRLSDALIEYMANQAKSGHTPRWLNLEYLSAEDWVMDCHGLSSIHPATGLQQTFWFPSVTEQSGGLIRESALIQQRDAFQQSPQQQAEFWQSLGIVNADFFARKISLFSYENKAIADLLTALRDDSETSLLLVPKSKSIPDIEAWLGHSLHVHDVVQCGPLTIVVLPFLSQQQYDQLLWACTLNFIRGEDSCVRAQWAGKPFIWHIYPQDEPEEHGSARAQGAHLVKLQAWIDRVDAATTANPSWHAAMHLWNGEGHSHVASWQKMLQQLATWQTQATQWSNYLSSQTGLAERLVAWMVKQ